MDLIGGGKIMRQYPVLFFFVSLFFSLLTCNVWSRCSSNPSKLARVSELYQQLLQPNNDNILLNSYCEKIAMDIPSCQRYIDELDNYELICQRVGVFVDDKETNIFMLGMYKEQRLSIIEKSLMEIKGSIEIQNFAKVHNAFNMVKNQYIQWKSEDYPFLNDFAELFEKTLVEKVTAMLAHCESLMLEISRKLPFLTNKLHHQRVEDFVHIFNDFTQELQSAIPMYKSLLNEYKIKLLGMRSQKTMKVRRSSIQFPIDVNEELQTSLSVNESTKNMLNIFKFWKDLYNVVTANGYLQSFKIEKNKYIDEINNLINIAESLNHLSKDLKVQHSSGDEEIERCPTDPLSIRTSVKKLQKRSSIEQISMLRDPVQQ